jgi:glycosyltransferase involved in cell wall biosynthesis
VPKVSVITAAYNAENYIRDSIDSILNQTFQDFELIIIDDNSSDKTPDILAEYTRKNPRILCLKNSRNHGCMYSRNRGLLSAQGEYIAIHDADDISLPYRLVKEIDLLDQNKQLTFIGSHALRISQTGSPLGLMSYPPPDTRRAFTMITAFKLNPIIDPSSMFRKNIVCQHGGYTLNDTLQVAGDFELWCRLLNHGYLMANIQEPLIKYRINTRGITQTRKNDMYNATEIILAKFKRGNLTDPNLCPELFLQEKHGETQNERKQ